MPGGRRYGFSIGTGYPGESWVEKMRETRGKCRILHEYGREKSPGAGNQKFPSKSTVPDSILMLPEAKSRLNDPKRSNPDFHIFFIFSVGSDTK